jgi:hypothetical protein
MLTVPGADRKVSCSSSGHPREKEIRATLQNLENKSAQAGHFCYNLFMQEGKAKQVLIILGAAVVLVLTLRFFFGNEDAWICKNGQWIKHGNPSAAMPTKTCAN